MNTTNKRAAQPKTRPSATNDSPAHDWLAPIDPVSPCGVDLEYDPEFVVLAARVAAKMDAQYGDFVGSAEPINWGEVDRDCRRMMMRSKDIRIAILFARCRTRLAGANGLAEGLRLLASWLGAYPDTIHPQPGVDEDRDAALEIRMNALQALTDMEGLLSDVREIALTRSSVARLQVRDVERAFAQPRASDALTVESVTRQLEDMRVQQPAVFAGFEIALASLDEIDAWSQQHLGVYAPDLSALSRVLRRVAGDFVTAAPTMAPLGPEDEVVRTTSDAAADESNDAHTDIADARALVDVAAPMPRVETHARGRDDALESMRAVRLWFERHEPSSPIPLLLRRAESLVGKGYAEIIGAIPSDLIEKWSVDA
ncbi:ImpA domain-containing protein [Caballeronia pedi]|uniref:ImpA domain-containing protein n=1 Tax=Caballeronia pedi TaxID=1777141 RepID=A0A157ZVA8_9BURK|nr:type VI secretion system protein TssA [Caballeronia pedi]SAK49450.1 ImpA domain-containing protein [Caballeronia pedi]